MGDRLCTQHSRKQPTYGTLFSILSSLGLSVDLGTSLLQKVRGDIMAKEELTCDVVEKILLDLEETIELLQKIKKRFKYFHSRNFNL